MSKPTREWCDGKNPWFKRAADQAMANDSFKAIANNSAEFREWMKFFQYELRFVPQFMYAARERPAGYEVTLPSRWPSGGAT